MHKECPLILQNLREGITEVNGAVKRLELEVAPIRTIFGLSENKLFSVLVGAVLLGFTSWVIVSIRALPEPIHIEEIRQRQMAVIVEAARNAQADAVLAEKQANIERLLVETRAAVGRIEDRLARR
jgi:hypothetical protein